VARVYVTRVYCRSSGKRGLSSSAQPAGVRACVRRPPTSPPLAVSNASCTTQCCIQCDAMNLLWHAENRVSHVEDLVISPHGRLAARCTHRWSVSCLQIIFSKKRSCSAPDRGNRHTGECLSCGKQPSGSLEAKRVKVIG